MKILKEHLWPAVQSLSKLAGGVLPILSSFRIEAEKGAMTVRATDLDQDAHVSIECSGELPPLCVRASHFTELVSRASDALTLTNGNNRLAIDSDWKAQLPILPAAEFPEPMFTDGVAQGCSTGALANAIEVVAWAASDDPERYKLMGVHVVLSEQNIEAECSDSRVLGHYLIPSIAGKADFLLPAEFADAVVKALREPESTVFLSEKAIRVSHKHGQYGCKLMDATYPSTKQILQEERMELGTLNLVETLSHIEMCRALSEEDYPSVELAFSKSGCEIKSIAHKPGQNDYAAIVAGKFNDYSFPTAVKKLIRGLKSFRGVESAKVFSGLQKLIIAHNEYVMIISQIGK